MAFTNSMTTLLNKIERRLGTKLWNLPEGLRKEDWVEAILEDTLPTFSRYFPHQIPYIIDTARDRGADGYYYINEDLIPGDVKILGIKDLNLQKFASSTINQIAASGVYDWTNNNLYSFEDIAMRQMMADRRSIYNNDILVYFEEPNRIKFENPNGYDVTKMTKDVHIYVFIEHSPNLQTIAPTKMETFERLAILDVKSMLYNALKLFDNLESVLGTIDMKISDWSGVEQDRESFVKEELEAKYVSAANKNQPMMFTI